MLRFRCATVVTAIIVGLGAAACHAQTAADANAPTSTAKIMAGNLRARLVWATDSPPFGSRGGAGGIAFSPDGRTLVTTALTIWEVPSGRALGRLVPASKLDRDGVMSIAYSPDGKWIVVNRGMGYSTLLDAATGKERFTKKLHNETILHTRFLPDSSAFVTGGSDGRLYVTRVEDQAEVAAWTIKPANGVRGGNNPFGGGGGGDEMVAGLDVAADGKRIVTTHWNDNSSEAILWQIGSDEPLMRIERPNDGSARVFEATRFSPDGMQLISGGARVVPLASTPLKAGPQNVNIVVIRRWDAKTGQLVEEISDPQVYGNGALEVSPEGRTIATDDLGAIHIWRLGEKRAFRAIERPGYGSIERIAFSPDGKRTASGVGNSITIWDVASGEVVSPAHEIMLPIAEVAWGNSGGTFAIARGSNIDVYDLAQRQRIKTFSAGEDVGGFGRGATVYHLAFSKGDATLIVMAERPEPPSRMLNVIEIWDVASAQKRGEIELIQSLQRDYFRFALAPDGRHAAWPYAKVDGQRVELGLALVDMPAKKELAALREMRDAKALRFSPDSHSAWIVGSDGQVLRWNPENNSQDGKYVTEWRDEKDRGGPNDMSPIRSAVFSTDGQLLVTSHDRTNRANRADALVFWDNELGLARRVLRDQPAYELTISPDGRLLAGFELSVNGGKTANTIHIWETITGNELLRLEPNDARAATAIAFSPDSCDMLIGYDRGTFEIWEIK